MIPNIALINRTSKISDAEALKVCGALAEQVSSHFAPQWGLDAMLHFVPLKGVPDPSHWWIILSDNSDEAGALGYHDLTPSGLPLGKVFVETTKKYGEHWEVTASHEVLEMIADPDINLTVLVDSPGKLRDYFMSYEVCDPCQALTYTINGVPVSDFVTPAYFEQFWSDVPYAKRPRLDYLGKIKDPFEILPGGYASVYKVGTGRWSQVDSKLLHSHKFQDRARVGSRRERRGIPRGQWLWSRRGAK